MKKVLLIMAAMLMLAGCIPKITYQYSIVTEPELMKDTTVIIGNAMVSRKEYKSTNYFGGLRKDTATIKGIEFEQQLVYNGMQGNNIQISYREFSDNMARPAFNQEIYYDLSKSKIVKYKNYTIEVDSADNNQIFYKLIAR